MKLHDETSKPLWVERADLHFGADLTPVELALEELAERPRHDTPSSWAGSLGEPFKAQEQRP